MVHRTVDLRRHAGHADILREQLDGSVGLLPGNSNIPDATDWPTYTQRLGTPPTSGPPALTTLTVQRHGGYRPAAVHRAASATVKMTSTDRFKVRGSMPARCTIRVVNASDTLHFVSFQRVRKGTTDRQVQQYFASGNQAPPPWAVQGPEMGTDVLTPGQPLKLSYRLHPGTYVLVCFIADDKSGMPHAIMGMHKVVDLG